uniref:Uncharacterized protein n=1 Tax=Cyclopterus lumpus TaxID=8103 RepID=A0A8C2WET8_CYCLU
MSGIFTMCCGALFLKIHYGQSVPKHSLLLLYWFAKIVEIDENNVIWMTFDPNREDYGSHYYHNSEGVLEELDGNNAYYTIGNLHQETSMQLPSYVSRPRTEYVGRNRDRIIIRVRIEHVYITQHYDMSENLGTEYDPYHTYRITINLMRQIREFSEYKVWTQISLKAQARHIPLNTDCKLSLLQISTRH